MFLHAKGAADTIVKTFAHMGVCLSVQSKNNGQAVSERVGSSGQSLHDRLAERPSNDRAILRWT